MKFTISILLLTTLLIGCSSKKKFKEMEEKLELVTLMAYQLEAEKSKLEKKVRQLENNQLYSGAQNSKYIKSGRKEVHIVDKPNPEEDKRRLFVLRMKVMNYQLRNETFPETVQELKTVLGELPNESLCHSNVVHLERNGKGGWIYDPDEGELDINTCAK